MTHLLWAGPNFRKQLQSGPQNCWIDQVQGGRWTFGCFHLARPPSFELFNRRTWGCLSIPSLISRCPHSFWPATLNHWARWVWYLPTNFQSHLPFNSTATVDSYQRPECLDVPNSNFKLIIYILLTVGQWILISRHIIYIDIDFDFRFFTRRNADSIFSLYYIRRLLLQTWRKSWHIMHRRKLWWIVHRKIFICSRISPLYSKVVKLLLKIAGQA